MLKYTKDKEFVGKMFDEISPTYDKLNHLLSGWQDIRWRRKAVDHLASLGYKYDFILDLAAGSGDLGLEFTRLNPKKIYSVDLSEQMLKINKDKLPKDINTVIQAEAEHLPLENGLFNLCGIGFGVRNFQNLGACLLEINRVLKPGAKFLTIEMFKPEKQTLMNRSFKLYFEKILPKIGNRLSHSKYAYDYLFQSVDSFMSHKAYSKLLEENGFKTTRITNNFLGFVYSVFAEKI